MEEKGVSFGSKAFRWIVLFLMSFSWFIILTGGDWKFVIGLMLMIAVHEYGHLLAAKFVGGVKTGGFYFLPIGGMSFIGSHPECRFKRFVIAIGGPAIGWLLCLLGLFLYKNYPADFLKPILGIWIIINLFNLIPLYPLDGGRIFHQLFASAFGEDWGLRLTFALTWILTVLVFVYTRSLMFPIIVILMIHFWGRPDREEKSGKPMRLSLTLLSGSLYWVLVLLYFILRYELGFLIVHN